MIQNYTDHRHKDFSKIIIFCSSDATNNFDEGTSPPQAKETAELAQNFSVSPALAKYESLFSWFYYLIPTVACRGCSRQT